MVKFAACQYALERFASWNEFATHFAALVDEAAASGAEIVLMPEYSAMALTGLLSDDLCADLHGSIAAIFRTLGFACAIQHTVGHITHGFLCSFADFVQHHEIVVAAVG